MHDVVEFLRRHPPFGELAEADLEELARSAEVEFHPAGDRIFRQGEQPIDHLWMIRRGVVELSQDGQALDVLSEGELLGHPWMLARLPAGLEAKAAEDTLTYRFPADVVEPVLARPGGVHYLGRSLTDRMSIASAPGGPSGSEAELDPVEQPVDRLSRRHPVICDRRSTVREAAP